MRFKSKKLLSLLMAMIMILTSFTTSPALADNEILNEDTVVETVGEGAEQAPSFQEEGTENQESTESQNQPAQTEGTNTVTKNNEATEVQANNTPAQNEEQGTTEQNNASNTAPSETPTENVTETTTPAQNTTTESQQTPAETQQATAENQESQPAENTETGKTEENNAENNQTANQPDGATQQNPADTNTQNQDPATQTESSATATSETPNDESKQNTETVPAETASPNNENSQPAGEESSIPNEQKMEESSSSEKPVEESSTENSEESKEEEKEPLPPNKVEYNEDPLKPADVSYTPAFTKTIAYPLTYEGGVTTEFGVVDAEHKHGHSGMDIACGEGTPVLASVSGYVSIVHVWTGYIDETVTYDSYGNMVAITGDNGITIYYGHLREISVSQGERVEVGRQIGLSGNTGHSTGPHLHFEVVINGHDVNPRLYLYSRENKDIDKLDFSSKRLFVKINGLDEDGMIIKEENIVSLSAEYALLKFETEEETKEAYKFLYGAADFVVPDIEIRNPWNEKPDIKELDDTYYSSILPNYIEYYDLMDSESYDEEIRLQKIAQGDQEAAKSAPSIYADNDIAIVVPSLVGDNSELGYASVSVKRLTAEEKKAAYDKKTEEEKKLGLISADPTTVSMIENIKAGKADVKVFLSEAVNADGSMSLSGLYMAMKLALKSWAKVVVVPHNIEEYMPNDAISYLIEGAVKDKSENDKPVFIAVSEPRTDDFSTDAIASKEDNEILKSVWTNMDSVIRIASQKSVYTEKDEKEWQKLNTLDYLVDAKDVYEAISIFAGEYLKNKDNVIANEKIVKTEYEVEEEKGEEKAEESSAPEEQPTEKPEETENKPETNDPSETKEEEKDPKETEDSASQEQNESEADAPTVIETELSLPDEAYEEYSVLSETEASDNEELLLMTNLSLPAKKMLSRSPQLLAAPPANREPVTADGQVIESVTIKWLSKSTGASEAAGYDRLVTSADTDTMQNMQFQIDFAISGKDKHDAGSIELVFPASIFKTRDGNEMGVLTLSVPEEPENGADFAWRREGDNIIITNVRPLSAASKVMIQGTWRNVMDGRVITGAHEMIDIDTVNPSSQFNNGVSDPLSATLFLTTKEGSTISMDSNNIDASINTKIDVTAATKTAYNVTNKAYSMYMSESDAISKGQLPEAMRFASNADDYIYVRWYITGKAFGSQPFVMTSTEIPDPNFETVILGAEVGENVILPSGDPFTFEIMSGYNLQSRSAYIWTAYPKSQFDPEADSITINNTQRITVTGLDDNRTTTRDASASVSLHMPKTYSVTKEWDDNDNEHGVRPDHVVIHINRKLSTDDSSYYGFWKTVTLSEDNNWTYEWSDDGVPYNYSLSEVLVNAKGTYDRYYDLNGFAHYIQWNYYLKNTFFDSEINRWTFVNAYSEGWIKYEVSAMNKDVEFKFADNRTISTRDGLSINELQKGNPVDIIYNLSGDAETSWWTVNLGHTPVKVSMTDDLYTFAGSNVTTDDMDIRAAALTLYNVYDYVNYDDTTGYYARQLVSEPEALILEGLYEGSWVKYADISNKGLVTNVYNGATRATTRKVIFPKGVTQVRYSVDTVHAAVILEADVTLRVYPSELVLSKIDEKFEESDYAVLPVLNRATMTIQDGSETVITMQCPATGFIHGRMYRIAAYETKEFQVAGDDNVKRILTLRATSTVVQQSNIVDYSEYLSAVESGLAPSTSSGTFYDLLPPGIEPDVNTIRLQEGDNVVQAYTVSNYKNSGRTLLVVKCEFSPHYSKLEDGYINGSAITVGNNDPSFPRSGYRNTQKITFDCYYSWEDALKYGLENVENNIAYEADETRVGTIKNWSGERDDASGTNNKTTLDAVLNSQEYMADLDPDRNDPSVVYAHAYLASYSPDFTALTQLLKHVATEESGRWSYGLEGDVNVYEGGKYMYRLYIKSSETTMSKDLILVDAIERYVPAEEDGADFGDAQWRGKFVSIDVSPLIEAGVNPVVYYSTTVTDVANLNPTQEKGVVLNMLQTSPDWSTTCPADPSTVTAIAIDCTKDAEGNDFILGSSEELMAYIHMIAPAGAEADYCFAATGYDNPANNAHAYNNVYMDLTQMDEIGRETLHDYVFFNYNKVGISASDLNVRKVWDDGNNRDGKRLAEVTVHLYSKGLDTGKTVVLSSQNDWAASFGRMPKYDANGIPIIYSFVEENNEDYHLRLGRDTDGTYVLNNIHEPEKINFVVNKEWLDDIADDGSSARPESITINLYANGVYKTQKIVRPDIDGNWSVSFNDLFKYENGSEISYTVTENPIEGYITTYSPDYHEVTNRYYPYGDIKISKEVQNATAASDGKQFVFTLSLTKDGQSLTERYAFEKSTGETGYITSGSTFELADSEWIVIKDVPIKTSYHIEEDKEPGFATTATGNDDVIKTGITSEVDFVNKYSATGSASIGGMKTLEGREIEKYQFGFSLYDSEMNRYRSTANKADGSYVFSTIKYTEKDHGKTFTYYVKEDDRGKPGYTYDTTEYRVEVTPTDNGDGTMRVDVKYYKGSSVAQSPDFANKYTASGDLILRAWKKLIGRNMVDGEFRFKLIGTDGTKATASNFADGSVEFQALHFDETDIGKTYYYSISEIKGSDETVNYDENTYGYSVTVYDNGDGTLSFSQGTATPIYGEAAATSNPDAVRYAVSLYGINHDVDESGKTLPLTFGPASGASYLADYVSASHNGADHSGTTALGNAHRCIHDDYVSGGWRLINEWAGKDPYVYECCYGDATHPSCTATVEIAISGSVLGSYYNSATYTQNGDGVGKIADDFNSTMKWNKDLSNGGWVTSRIRALLNGNIENDDITYISDRQDYEEYDFKASNESASRTNGAVVSSRGSERYFEPAAGEDIYTVTSTKIDDYTYEVTLTGKYPNENAVFALLPEELQLSIAPKKVLSSSRNTSTARTTYDRLWLFSAVELGAAMHAEEGSTYEKITARGNQMSDRKLYGDAGSGIPRSNAIMDGGALLRTAVGGREYVQEIKSDGDIGTASNVLSNQMDVAFGFCLSGEPIPPQIVGWETEDAPLPVFENTLKPGSISITKEVTWDEGDEPNLTQTFHFKVKFTGDDIDYENLPVESGEKPQPTATVTYVGNGGIFNNDPSITTNAVSYEWDSANREYQLVSGTYSEPTSEGLYFRGWYKDAECTQRYDFDLANLRHDITLYARFTTQPHTLTVKYIYNYNSTEQELAESKTYEYSNGEEYQIDLLHINGYVLRGYYLDSGVTGEKTLTQTELEQKKLIGTMGNVDKTIKVYYVPKTINVSINYVDIQGNLVSTSNYMTGLVVGDYYGYKENRDRDSLLYDFNHNSVLVDSNESKNHYTLPQDASASFVIGDEDIVLEVLVRGNPLYLRIHKQNEESYEFGYEDYTVYYKEPYEIPAPSRTGYSVEPAVITGVPTTYNTTHAYVTYTPIQYTLLLIGQTTSGTELWRRSATLMYNDYYEGSTYANENDSGWFSVPEIEGYYCDDQWSSPEGNMPDHDVTMVFEYEPEEIAINFACYTLDESEYLYDSYYEHYVRFNEPYSIEIPEIEGYTFDHSTFPMSGTITEYPGSEVYATLYYDYSQ